MTNMGILGNYTHMRRLCVQSYRQLRRIVLSKLARNFELLDLRSISASWLVICAIIYALQNSHEFVDPEKKLLIRRPFQSMSINYRFPDKRKVVRIFFSTNKHETLGGGQWNFEYSVCINSCFILLIRFNLK